MSVVHSIIEKVARLEGVDPVDLEPTLHEVVDTEALEALSSSVEHRHYGRFPTVEFVYHGYPVTVHGDGSVRVDDGLGRGAGVSDPADGPGAESDDRARAMAAAADAIGAPDRPFLDRLDSLLEEGTELLDTESATLSYADADTYVFEAVAGAANVEIRTGQTVPLAETVCERVVETERALVLGDVEADAPGLAGLACDVSSYIGVPVFVDGAVYGTFCFFSSEPRAEAFTDWDLAFVELVSNWVSAELERRARERALQARTTERPGGVS